MNAKPCLCNGEVISQGYIIPKETTATGFEAQASLKLETPSLWLWTWCIKYVRHGNPNSGHEDVLESHDKYGVLILE